MAPSQLSREKRPLAARASPSGRDWIVTSGEWLGALAVAESAAGSNGHGLQTRAQRCGSVYVLNGSKTLVTQAADAGLIIVCADLQDADGAAADSGGPAHHP